MRIDTALSEKLKMLMQSMGYELVGCECLPQGTRQLFRVYIDIANAQSGNSVTLDDCAKASYQIGAMLDAEEIIAGRYTLEVSSPGIDRPLFELKDFKRYIGSRIKLKLYMAINRRRQYQGILKEVVDEQIHLLVSDTEQVLVIPFSAIEKANVMGEINW